MQVKPMAEILGGILGVLGASVGVWAMLAAMGIGEYLGGKKSGRVASMPKEELAKRLLALNATKVPYTISPSSETDLMLEWKIADAAWWGFFSRNRVCQTYRAYILLDPQRKSARYYEETARVDWSAGSDGLLKPFITYRKQSFHGRILFQKSWEKQYSPNGSLVYEINFDVNRLRAPVKAAVEQAGWEFVPVVRRSHATH